LASHGDASPKRETFGSLLSAIIAASGLGHGGLAAHLGTSGKTLARYQAGVPVPPARARDIVFRLMSTNVPDALRHKAADLLGIARIERAPVANVIPRASGEAILTAAVQGVAEELDVLASTVRLSAMTVLDVAAEHGMDVAQTRSFLSPTKPKGKAKAKKSASS
jgi:hypothetical protein